MYKKKAKWMNWVRFLIGPISLAALFPLLFEQQAASQSAVGDYGHFLGYTPVTHFLNHDNRDFTITVHVMQWGTEHWNKPKEQVKLTDPDGQVLVDGKQKLKDATWEYKVSPGKEGVYSLETGGNTWISSSLERAVVWTGRSEGHIADNQRGIVFQPAVPRRWWFFVPGNVTEFTVSAQRADRYMSQRERWAFFVISPRGQRTNALVGQPPKAGTYRQEMETTVEVEPGAQGRFWSIEVGLGDAHIYSNINIALDGVPPYLARSPEEWFDPRSGKLAEVTVYEDLPYTQWFQGSGEVKAEIEDRWPELQHWVPVPSLGCPEVQVRGNAEFQLWNPEGKKLNFKMGTYIPRKWQGEPERAQLKITGPDNAELVRDSVAINHLHGKEGNGFSHSFQFTGVATASVRDAERWFAYTLPATPIVLVGRQAGATSDVGEFNLNFGTAREWYFYVPEGTEKFEVGAFCEHETDVVKLSVSAPDRIMTIIHGNKGNQRIDVPKGLSGKIWHVRLEVGQATRMVTRKATGGRFQEINLRLILKGVPPYIAPSWEQWFNPEDPRLPHQR